jgi:thermostable 8-oxoguanine DNA glycosylase
MAPSLSHDPDAEVVPGVKWGRPEWVPSPAFWLMLANNADEEHDNYIAPQGTPLHHELGFCLLGGYGVRMEMNRATWLMLLGEGILEVGRRPSASEIESLLRRPVTVGRTQARYRFPKQRAQRLSVALRMIEEEPPSIGSSAEFRRCLMQIPGIGPKTASWLARNWLGSDDVAIIDIHVLRAGQRMNLFMPNVRLPDDYSELESRFIDFAHALSVRPSLLDAIIWREMRLLGRHAPLHDH